MSTVTDPVTGASIRSLGRPGPTGSTAAPGETMQRRAVAATLACIARHGVAKTTAEDVAREMGVSRATLYRHVDGMPALVRTTVAVELERAMTDIELAVAGSADLEDALVAFFSAADRSLHTHVALAFVITHEPELVLPFLAFDRGAALLTRCGNRFAPVFRPFVASDDVAGRVAEWAARVVLSCAFSPDADLELSDASAVRDLVATFLVPAFAPPLGVPS